MEEFELENDVAVQLHKEMEDAEIEVFTFVSHLSAAVSLKRIADSLAALVDMLGNKFNAERVN